jgi:cytochrome c biogenesis protein CcmG/thiol:disulfide interchange protein DsbE
MISSPGRASLPTALRGLTLGLLLGALALWLFRGNGAERILDALPGRSPRAVEVGARAPDFNLQSIDGNTVSLSDYRGKVVVLNFWATWCTPCLAEMPALEHVYQTQRDRGLVVIGVDVQEPAEKVRAFLPQVGVTFPIVLDSDTALAQRYRATGLPATFIVDRQGSVRDIRIGPYTEDMLLSRLEPLLGG